MAVVLDRDEEAGTGGAADPILEEAVRRLVAGFGPERVLLFGSRAWGKSGPHSDYDLFVILAGEVDTRTMAGKMRWALLDLPASFDIIVRSLGWWEEWSRKPFTMERRVERDGRVLHGS